MPPPSGRDGPAAARRRASSLLLLVVGGIGIASADRIWGQQPVTDAAPGSARTVEVGSAAGPGMLPGREPAETASSASADESPLRFLRVHVPAGAAAALPRNGRRYVPMPLLEFEAAVAGLLSDGQPAGTPPRTRGGPGGGIGRVSLEHVRYDSSWSDASLRGTLWFDVAAPDEQGRSIVAIEGLLVDSALVESAAGTGAAAMVAAGDGSLGIVTRLAGRYRCAWRLPQDGRSGRRAESDASVRLPLLPALSSTYRLLLPPGLHATLVVLEDGSPTDGEPASRWIGTRPLGIESLADGGTRLTWLLGPVDAATIRITPRSDHEGRVFVHNVVALARRQADVQADVVPRAPWNGAAVSFLVDARFDTASLDVSCLDAASLPARADWYVEPSPRGSRVVVVPPDRAVGTRMPLRIAGLASFEAGDAAAAVPLVTVDDSAWGGGRIDVALDASTTFTRIEPEAAAVLPVDGDADEVPRVSLEQQSAAGTVRLAVGVRQPAVEVSRVTSVDLSPASVAARTAAALRVTRGEVFAISGRIGPGWFIDGVEVEGAYGPADWRVDRDETGGLLRISLVAGVAAGSEAKLRVVGHRPPLPFGRPIGDERLEMVRFDGELDGETFIDLRADAETTVFVTGREPVSSAGDSLPERVRPLCEQQPPRLRLPAGSLAGERKLTILRRRPPVDVATSIRVTVRDDRISEAFTFDCSPRDSELDSIIVHFSEATDDALEWSVLAPSAARAVARRAEGDERRSSVAAVAGVESWVVEVQPPVRGPLAVRATRSLGWSGRHRVPLAWVEGAPSRTGELVIRDAGRTPPRLVTGGLPELPDTQASTDRGAGGIATFMFDVDRDLRDGRTPVEVEPGDADSADARAWVWSERTLSWCHASGAVEHETVLEIENHGRNALALNHPVGTRLRGVSLDGIRLPASTSEARGGGMRITLPTGRRFVQVVARLSEDPPRHENDPSLSVPRMGSVPSGRLDRSPALAWLGLRRFAAPSGIVDLPVLQRSWTVQLAPGLEAIADLGQSGKDRGRRSDWIHRLAAASPRANGAAVEAASPVTDAFAGDGGPAGIDGGFRRLEVSGRGNGTTASIVVVRRDAVVRLALAAGLSGLALGWWGAFAGRSVRRAAVACLLPAAAVAALWLPEPWFAVPRALLWGLALPFVGLAVFGPARDGRGEGEHREGKAGHGRRSAGRLGGWVGMALGTMTVLFGSTTSAQAPDLERVFILEEQGETALVPENLFRRLAREAREPVSLGPVVTACRIVAIVDGSFGGDPPALVARWRYDLEVEGAGIVSFQIPPGAGRLGRGSARLDGQIVPDAVDASGTRLQIPIPEAGRHAVSVGVSPEMAVVRDAADAAAVGEAIVRAVAHVPAALSASLVIEPGPLAATPERGSLPLAAATSNAGVEGPWLPLDVAMDQPSSLAGAVALMLGWPTREGRRLLRRPYEIDCLEDVVWDERGCRVAAVLTPRFAGESADGPSRSADAAVAWPVFELGIDPELELSVADGPILDSVGRPVRVARIGPERLLVEWLSPVSQSPTLTIPLEMPLEAPAGVFDVPSVWPITPHAGEAGPARPGVPGRREVRLSAVASLKASVELGVASVRLPAAGAGVFEQAAAWIPSPEGARDIVRVSRRRSASVASQRMALTATATSMLVTLEAVLDGGSDAVSGLTLTIPADAVVESVRLASPAAGGPSRADRSVDIAVHRPGPTALAICPQRPSRDRFELRVALRVPPPAEDDWSVLPLAFLSDTEEAPLALSWRLPDGAIVEFETEPKRGRESVTIPVIGPPPRYRLIPSSAEAGQPEGLARARDDAAAAAEATPRVIAAEPDAGEAMAALDAGSPAGETVSPAPQADRFRVELADVLLAVDGRGRAWGCVRFELVPPDDRPVIRLPRGLRLFGAFVDECPRRARPVDASGWELDLLDASRPRTVTAVFAGDLGTGLAAGDTVEIEPPRIDGVPTRQVAWTVRGPTDRGLRPVDPSAVVSAEGIAAARREALDRLTPDVIRAFEGRTPDEQMRIRIFLERSGPPEPSSPEATWERSSRSLEAGFLVLDPVRPPAQPLLAAGRPLRFRAPAAAAPRAAGSAVATLVILAVAAAAARVAAACDARFPRTSWHLTAAVAAVVLAAAWSLYVTPAWPGLVVCLWITITWIRRLVFARLQTPVDPAAA